MVSDFSWHFSHKYGTLAGAGHGCHLADSAPMAGREASCFQILRVKTSGLCPAFRGGEGIWDGVVSPLTKVLQCLSIGISLGSCCFLPQGSVVLWCHCWARCVLEHGEVTRARHRSCLAWVSLYPSGYINNYRNWEHIS